MCGFVGVFNKHPLTQTADQEELIKQMNQMIVHRGPDSDGYYHDEISRRIRLQTAQYY